MDFNASLWRKVQCKSVSVSLYLYLVSCVWVCCILCKVKAVLHPQTTHHPALTRLDLCKWKALLSAALNSENKCNSVAVLGCTYRQGLTGSHRVLTVSYPGQKYQKHRYKIVATNTLYIHYKECLSTRVVCWIIFVAGKDSFFLYENEGGFAYKLSNDQKT